MSYICNNSQCGGKRSEIETVKANLQGMRCGFCDAELQPMDRVEEASTADQSAEPTTEPKKTKHTTDDTTTDNKQPAVQSSEKISDTLAPPEFISCTMEWHEGALFASKNFSIHFVPHGLPGRSALDFSHGVARLGDKAAITEASYNGLEVRGQLPDNAGTQMLRVSFALPAPNGSDLWYFEYARLLSIEDKETDERIKARHADKTVNVQSKGGDGAVNYTAVEFEKDAEVSKLDYSLKRSEVRFKRRAYSEASAANKATTPVRGFTLRPGLKGAAATHVRLLNQPVSFGRVGGPADLHISAPFADTTKKSETNKLISGKHFKLEFINKQFCLTDTATWGTTYNGTPISTIATDKTVNLNEQDTLGMPYPSRVYLRCEHVREGLLMSFPVDGGIDRDTAESYLIVPPGESSKGWVQCKHGSLVLGGDGKNTVTAGSKPINEVRPVPALTEKDNTERLDQNVHTLINLVV